MEQDCGTSVIPLHIPWGLEFGMARTRWRLLELSLKYAIFSKQKKRKLFFLSSFCPRNYFFFMKYHAHYHKSVFIITGVSLHQPCVLLHGRTVLLVLTAGLLSFDFSTWICLVSTPGSWSSLNLACSSTAGLVGLIT